MGFQIVMDISDLFEYAEVDFFREEFTGLDDGG